MSPLLSLQNVTLIVAGKHLLDSVNWQIQPQERIALVGRNGAGKSSLLQLLQKELVADSGKIQTATNLTVSSLCQKVPLLQAQEKVHPFLLKGLGSVGNILSTYYHLLPGKDMEALDACQKEMDSTNAWDLLPRVEALIKEWDIDLYAPMHALSGGKKRLVLLAAALLSAPDLLLLDEPTNHLDIKTIEKLESHLTSFKGSILFVTHDRTFLDSIATRIVELDRGILTSYACNYETYVSRREAALLAERKEIDRFDKHLQQEEIFSKKGVKARRARNEGRMKKLQLMREEVRQRKTQLGKMETLHYDATRSGCLVLEAKNVNYQIDNKILLNDFSLRVSYKDKIGIIGPNGCGKTTLVRLLLGELTPQSGSIRQGTHLKVAYFDQLRQQFEEQQTLIANVAEGADFVHIQGKDLHVASYLKRFLFSEHQFLQPVHTLSLGEKNRLLLAKLLAKPVNFLVMDEPTNDLDMETLELLESMLVEYPGTIILISHDRTFINHVVTSVLVYEKEGVFREYLGDYDSVQQPPAPSLPTFSSKPSASSHLSFQEQKELSALPRKIETLEAKIAALQQNFQSPDYYQNLPSLAELKKEVASQEEVLEALYARWEDLEGRKNHA